MQYVPTTALKALLQRSFHDFDPQHIYKYACGSKSLQFRVSLRFYTPRYGIYYTI